MKKFVSIFFAFILILSCGCSKHKNNDSKHKYYKDNVATMLSVSSDGKYAITSHINKQILLWNLKNKTYKIIAHGANIYSAYFIKHSHNFLWQNDDDNEVVIENINGKIVKTFNPGFPVYGQVITTNMDNYFASDENWSLYSIKNGVLSLVKYDDGGFLGYGKILNLTLSNNDKKLLSSGFGFGCDSGKTCKTVIPPSSWVKDSEQLEDVVLWSVKTGKPIYNMPGGVSQTYAVLSPDGKYIIAGDSNSQVFVWYSKTGKRKYILWDLWRGKCVDINPKTDVCDYDSSKLKIKPPKDFVDWLGDAYDHVMGIKFIDKTHYLRFTYNIPYTILYSINSPQPIKYLRLDKKPYPAINTYVYPTIDTAPKAHILVISQAVGNGIIVYKYDPKTQTLHRTWVGNFKDNTK